VLDGEFISVALAGCWQNPAYCPGPLHYHFAGPNAGLEEPALGGPAQEAAQRRFFTAASSDAPTDIAANLVYRLRSVVKAGETWYNLHL
jgi:hypothetical protein